MAKQGSSMGIFDIISSSVFARRDPTLNFKLVHEGLHYPSKVEVVTLLVFPYTSCPSLLLPVGLTIGVAVLASILTE